MTDQAQPLSRGIDEACNMLGVGRSLLFELIERGEIRTFRLGRRRLIPESELKRLIADRLESSPGDHDE
ncbi:excisionase family DNA-binding protein [Salinisphaera orenii]|uniref:excisionase family DNA-binding protein n=1 Tax=Salinisphaera orenii TaxID=856731 RepID=UPI000DBE118F